MKESIVTDTTSLIGLERINLTGILPRLFDPVIIASQVAIEFGKSFEWLIVEGPTDKPLVTSLNLEMDLGEAETVALAHQRSSRVLLDDRRARSVAKRMGLHIIGTVGTLILAKQQLIIPMLGPILDQLKANNFYMSEELREEAIRIAGE